MLTRLRSNLVRLLDACRERDRLQAEVERLHQDRKRYVDAALAERAHMHRALWRSLHRALWRAVTGEDADPPGAIELCDRIRALVDERDVANRECLQAMEAEHALQAQVDRLTAERDSLAQDVSVLACRIDRIQQERDARIPVDIDGAQAWASDRGVSVVLDLVPDGVTLGYWWRVTVRGEMVMTTPSRITAVATAVRHALFRTWRDDA